MQDQGSSFNKGNPLGCWSKNDDLGCEEPDRESRNLMPKGSRMSGPSRSGGEQPKVEEFGKTGRGSELEIRLSSGRAFERTPNGQPDQ
jgi:hypothetical protein